MIVEALTFIQGRLNQTVFRDTSVKVRLGSAATLYDAGKNESNVLLSLVNIEEEVLLRRPENFTKTLTTVVYRNPPVYLNLTILFGTFKPESTAGTDADYKSSLTAIQGIIGFFQAQSVFDHRNTPDLDPGIQKLSFELVNMNLEQLHHLWSMMGGKYLPSVAYKMRLVMIDTATETTAPFITQVVLADTLKFQE